MLQILKYVLLLRTFLKGKKTYIVAIVAIFTALLGFIDGSLTLADFIQSIFTALGAMALRAGITNEKE